MDLNEELQILSKDIIDTIEKEDREFDFKYNRGFVERNVPASKFKSLVGLRCTDIEEIIGELDG